MKSKNPKVVVFRHPDGRFYIGDDGKGKAIHFTGASSKIFKDEAFICADNVQSIESIKTRVKSYFNIDLKHEKY